MRNIPNILTLGRLALVPIIVVLIWPGVESQQTCLWAGAVYFLGGLGDVLDGYIARKYDLETVSGKFLDPLADKLFYLITLLALLQLPGPRVPTLVVMIILTRELSITGLRTIAVSNGIVIGAGRGGKLKSTFATLGTVALLIHYPYIVHLGQWNIPINYHAIGLWLTYISLAFSLGSGAAYIRGFLLEKPNLR